MTHRIHMTLDAEYVPQWGIVEGCRELIQNWLDAGGEGKPEYGDGILTMDNPKAEGLCRSVLLIGRSTKADDDEQRGQFGEGLKLGALALVRKGCEVVVRTRDEVWTACLDEHPEFDRTVLAWDIQVTSGTRLNGVHVEVHGLTQEQWNNIEGRFRWDVPATTSEFLPDEPGRIYVKGIFVCKVDGMEHGYNLANAKVDRDRGLIDGFDLNYEACRLLCQSMSRGTVTADSVLDMALRKTDETKWLNSHCWGRQKELLTEAWKRRFNDALPCPDEKWAHRLEHIGRRGVVVAASLLECLNLPKAEDFYRDLLREGAPVESLTELEEKTLAWAKRQVNVPVTVLVVNFTEESMLGTYTPATQTVRLARHILSDRIRTLSTLIHEASHAIEGEDNVHGVDFLWEQAARKWLGE